MIYCIWGYHVMGDNHNGLYVGVVCYALYVITTSYLMEYIVRSAGINIRQPTPPPSVCDVLLTSFFFFCIPFLLYSCVPPHPATTHKMSTSLLCKRSRMMKEILDRQPPRTGYRTARHMQLASVLFFFF